MDARRRYYRLEVKRLLKLLSFGFVGWFPGLGGVLLLAFGNFNSALALGLVLSGGSAIIALSVWRSLERPEPVFGLSTKSTLAAFSKSPRWSDIANPKGNYASRWAMYEDLTFWLAERDWAGKTVAEIGYSNGALRSFIGGTYCRELPYPEYDIQNLYQIRDNELDLLILDQTLEHVPNPERALREVRRVLKPEATTIITTPFLIPVHRGSNFGDYYRWTPQGMETMLRRCGFEPKVSMWGYLEAAKALTADMYMRAEQARQLGLSLGLSDSDPKFPVMVWATATNVKLS